MVKSVSDARLPRRSMRDHVAERCTIFDALKLHDRSNKGPVVAVLPEPLQYFTVWETFHYG
jgi:hypothetical protein